MYCYGDISGYIDIMEKKKETPTYNKGHNRGIQG